MAHTLIASKAVGRMMDAEDELGALKNSIEKDFMGLSALNWFRASGISNTLSPRLNRGQRIYDVFGSRNNGHQD